MKTIGVYIHIPFCMQKCYYCDFTSFAKMETYQKQYIQALKNEIQEFLSKNPDIKITSIYIGGGTPSYIDSEYIKEILALFENKHDIEITIEINPGTINSKKLEDYKKARINRLSIGLQSTENRLLKTLGRIHNFEDFFNTYQLAQKVGFKNINVDLMIGLPNQTIADIKKSLEKIVELQAKHISVYSLILEEDTVLYKKVESGEIILPDEQLERDMYWYVKNFLELKGFNHYEISNFAKPGFESKHNLDCWEQQEYIGFGLAAHSYIENTRFSNIENLPKYIKNCEKDDFKANKKIQEIQNKFSKQQEYILLGLRKINGVSIQKFKNKFQENPIFIFRHEFNKLVEEGLLQINEDEIKLTNKGLDLANIVWEEFV